jgi:hypothetical protein
MTDKKREGPEEPEVIIVPPEDQDVMPPENSETVEAEFIDAAAASGDDIRDSKNSSRIGLWISLLVVAAFVGGFAAWPKLAPTLEPWLPESLKPGSSRLVEVTKALDELAVRIATLKNNSVDPNALVDLEDRIKTQLDDLREKVSTLQATVQVTPDNGDEVAALSERFSEIFDKSRTEIADLKKTITEMPLSAVGTSDQALATMQLRIDARVKAVASALEDLVERTSALEDKPVSSGSPVAPAYDHDNLERKVAALSTLSEELTSRLSAAEARLAAVVDASTNGRGAALVAATGQLRSRMESGQEYSADLSTINKLAAQDGDLKTLMTVLETGTAGMPSLVILQRDFANLAGDVIVAARAPATNWMDKVWQRLSSMVSVRRKGDIPGDDVPARMARAEQRLETGDLAAAVRELKEIPHSAATILSPWMQQAEKRLELVSALDQLTRAAVQRLASPAGAAE